MKNLLLSLSDYEDDKTCELFKKMEHVGKKVFLNKEELLEILKWKSPRPLQYYLENTDQEIEEITAAAFSTSSDSLKLHILTALRGVNYPAASAILMFFDQTRFPVLDIRVWQQLYFFKKVHENPKGQNFTLKQWNIYLSVIRELANELNITARQVEKRLFDYDQKTRAGKLYE